jgi:ribosomal protein S18 acetylase RimI-like enzyme
MVPGVSFQIRPLDDEAHDRDWAASLIIERWGAPVVVAHETVYRPAGLPGFVAWQAGQRVGLVTYHIQDDAHGAACEIVTIDSLRPGIGLGTALVQAVRDVAQAAGCHRLWLITTNDNLQALHFYQKRGFVLVAVHRDAVTRARQRKPEIPQIGLHGIPLRDEIELEMRLAQPGGHRG